MKHFLAIYTGAPDGGMRKAWDDLVPEERQQREQAGIHAWKGWVAAQGAAIIDVGGPLGQTRRVSADGIAPIANAMVGYTVVRAGSLDEAAALFREHPHFTVFPGDGVEVMEIMPIPAG